jgi:hypothetical protein
MVCAIEDAGFEIRDSIQWIYGSGFPKSKSMRDIDRPELGTALKPAHEPIVLARKPLSESSVARNVLEHGVGALNIDASRIGTTDTIEQSGETVTMGRETIAEGYDRPGRTMYRTDKPKERSGPANASGRWPANLILSHHEGCVPIGTRRVKGIGGGDQTKGPYTSETTWNTSSTPASNRNGYADPDGYETIEGYECQPDCPIFLLDEQSGPLQRDKHKPGKTYNNKPGTASFGLERNIGAWPKPYEDPAGSGASRFFKTFGGSDDSFAGNTSVSRRDGGGGDADISNPTRQIDLPQFTPDAEPGFFYNAKASRSERNAGLEGMPFRNRSDANKMMGEAGPMKTGSGNERTTTFQNSHPTVKPLALMRYLVRLITPPGGTVLDPFAGSGSTICAAVLEGFEGIGIEREIEYVEIARRRVEHWSLPESERQKTRTPARKRTTYGFKSTDVLRRCPEHGAAIPSGATTYRCGCAKVWTSADAVEVAVEDGRLF